jgi:hypothetical protein
MGPEKEEPKDHKRDLLSSNSFTEMELVHLILKPNRLNFQKRSNRTGLNSAYSKNGFSISNFLCFKTTLAL